MTTTIEVTDPVTGEPFAHVAVERDDPKPHLRVDLDYDVLLYPDDVRVLVSALLDAAVLIEAGR